MKKLIVALVVIGALMIPSVAQAHFIKTHFARQVTRSVSVDLYQSLNDSEGYGVGKCSRGDAHHVKCLGFVRGHSLDTAGVPQFWNCKFIARYFLTYNLGNDYHGWDVRAAIGAARCFGPGADFVQ